MEHIFFYEKANFAERFLAFIIDITLIAIVKDLVSLITETNLNIICVFPLYYFAYTYYTGKTPGKAVMKLKSISKGYPNEIVFIRVIIKIITMPLEPFFGIASKLSGIHTVREF